MIARSGSQRASSAGEYMGFRNIIVGLVQRKLLFFLLFAVAIILGIVGYFLTPLKYISSTTMVLVTPAFGGTLSLDPSRPTDLTNPLLNFNDNLKTASTILIYEMNSREVAAELGALDGPTKITVDDGRTNPNLILNNGPFVYIVGEATSRTEVTDVVIRAQKRMRQELIDRQKALNAPIETYVTLADVVAPTVPEVSRADRIKIGGVAFLLSFLMGLSAAYAWQRLREERPRRDMAERPFQRQEQESDGSFGWDSAGSRDSGVEESTADRQMTSTDTHRPHVGDRVAMDQLDRASSTPVSLVLRSAEDEEISPDEQVAGDEASPGLEQVAGDDAGTGTAQRTDYDEMLAEAHLPADEPLAGQADQSAEPQLAACADKQVDTVMRWPLYSVDFVENRDSRTDESTAAKWMTSTGAQLTGVGHRVAMDHLDPASSKPGTVALDLPADEGLAGQADQSAETELAAYPEEQVETVVHWNLYFVDHQPTDGEDPVPSSSNDELHTAWDWDLNDLHSERIS